MPGELRLTLMGRANRANSCRPCGHVACNPEANRPFDKESADFYRADPPQVRQRYVPADGQGATVDRGGDRCRRADSYRLPDGYGYRPVSSAPCMMCVCVRVCARVRACLCVCVIDS